MEVEATSLMSTLQGAAGNGPRLLSILSRAERAVSGRELCAVYRTALESYGQAEDEAYREICCRYMARLCESDVNEAREFHNRQRAFGITSDARMYEARALLEEREGEDVKAMKILQEGIRVGARPSDLLRRQLARLQREATPRRADTDQATQTAVPPVPRPSPALLAGWQRLRRVWRLTDALAAWKELRDAARQQRHTELFEALRQQLLLAERRCRGQGRGWQRLALRAWRCATQLGQQRRCLADVAYQEEMRRRASRVLLAWRCTREPRQKEPEELPMLESLLMDLQPPRAVLGAQNGRSPREEDQKRPLRGPERFFYDTSSYTGCARYGGPMIVEKKENLGCQRRQSKTGRPEKNA